MLFYDSLSHKVNNISPYLVDSKNLIVTGRKTALSNLPKMSFGSMPNDGGNFLFSENEFKDLFLSEKKYIKPALSAKEFLNEEKRYCIWIENPSQIDKNDYFLIKRINKVKKYRLESKRNATRKLADFPYRFGK